MSRTTKIFMAAGILLAVGILFCVVGAHFAKIRGELQSGKKQEASFRGITKLVTDLAISDVVLYPCQGDEILLEYYEYEGDIWTVEEAAGVLSIRRQTSWFRFDWQFLFGVGKNYEVRIGIPENYSGEFLISATTGSITAKDLSLPKGASFKATTGSITLENITAGDDLHLALTTGQVRANGVSCSGALRASATTGNVTVNTVSAESFFLKATTGNVKANLIAVETEAQLETTTGNIKCQVQDSAQNFMVFGHTNTGHAQIPSGGNGPKQLRANAATGNITVTFTED